ncbi:Lysine exporter protein (LYSE/YGGA) [Stappia aggregata IAM 12614]|uniref:Lysine exporter protein (LYSE/YGGA) n=1 Tax=Roseibium aggregatum (strain ATCC 25650 / DSM 13394 / JCM 20685 / NBRC 16684 / NCIMB 2208 / IAM 12614 / B1) TaxID=384765 RepID=A0NML0_ROSAI|nr:LysE family translocator [Roseibium aggregatum]EAV46305.1 Lysine exporter protein (LYSE/YGGA) [Stappia aggregata IAM 12614] [Roseibium aggregatum IAM 12614]
MQFDTYLIFLVTTAVVVFSPGAAAVAVASQGAANGGRRAFGGVLGIASANAVYFALSATGIASLIIASNMVFSAIKWAGVGYLVWLGLTALFTPAGAIRVKRGGRQSSLKALFAQGFVIEFANPKALLYFAAILPQFLNIDSAILPQILIMGLTTFLIDLTSYTAYAFLGDLLTQGGVKNWVVNLVNKCAGAALLYAGFRMAGVSVMR